LIKDAKTFPINLSRDTHIKTANNIIQAMEEYAELVKNHGVLHDVIPYLGTARLIKNNKGHSSIKNVTLGNSYQIIEKLDRSRLRKYNPKMNDGFWIINDLGKKVSFTNENLWDVSWV